MKHIALGLTAAALWAVLATPVHAQSSVSDKIRAALQQTCRSDANRARDRNRDPVAAMKFRNPRPMAASKFTMRQL